MIRRRDFIAGLGGVAAWPLTARAQQPDKMRRIGLLSGLAENDPIGQVIVTTLREELVRLGWVEGRNLRIDLRFGGVDSDRTRTYGRNW